MKSFELEEFNIEEDPETGGSCINVRSVTETTNNETEHANDSDNESMGSTVYNKSEHDQCLSEYSPSDEECDMPEDEHRFSSGRARLSVFMETADTQTFRELNFVPTELYGLLLFPQSEEAIRQYRFLRSTVAINESNHRCDEFCDNLGLVSRHEPNLPRFFGYECYLCPKRLPMQFALHRPAVGFSDCDTCSFAFFKAKPSVSTFIESMGYEFVMQKDVDFCLPTFMIRCTAPDSKPTSELTEEDFIVCIKVLTLLNGQTHRFSKDVRGNLIFSYGMDRHVQDLVSEYRYELKPFLDACLPLNWDDRKVKSD